MQFLNIILQVEHEFSQALHALSVAEAARPIVRKKTLRVASCMAEIAVIREFLLGCLARQAVQKGSL